MNIRDVHEQAKGYFADWIKIYDADNPWTIEDFPFAKGVPDSVDGHCWKCVTVNHCWFADEDGKKPQEMDSSQFIRKINSFLGTDDLYHPNCHCKKQTKAPPRVEEIKLIEVEGKIGYMWKDKLALFHLWGYFDLEKDSFEKMLAKKTKESYVSGNYEIEEHDKYGFKINCVFTIPCRNPQFGGEIEMWSNWMVFPNGTLKCNSYLGGWTK